VCVEVVQYLWLPEHLTSECVWKWFSIYGCQNTWHL